jgi:hypothetical protein
MANSARPDLAQFRVALADWYRTRAGSDQITFREITEPRNDPYPDYVLVYEAVFEPSSVEMARMEVWLTDDGYVGVGLETRGRIAKRLGRSWTGPKQFAAGHEPITVSVAELLSLLDAAAEGHLAIIARANRLLGVWSTKAVMDRQTYDRLKLTGHRDLRWISPLAEHADRFGRKLVTFRPWPVR